MKAPGSGGVRTTIELLGILHGELREMLRGIKRVAEEARAVRPRRRLRRLDPPLVRPAGRRIEPDLAKLHEKIEFP